MEGPEHYWQFQTDEFGIWRSICSAHMIEHDDDFGGIPAITLTFEHNPLEANRCELCLAAYAQTPYGKKYGVRPPYLHD